MGAVHALMWLGLVAQSMMGHDARLNLTVTDLLGAGVGGAKVELRSTEQPCQPAIATGVTHGNGAAQLIAPPGRYRVVVTAANFGVKQLTVVLSAADDQSRTVALKVTGEAICIDCDDWWPDFPEPGTRIVEHPGDYPTAIFDTELHGGMSPR